MVNASNKKKLSYMSMWFPKYENYTSEFLFVLSFYLQSEGLCSMLTEMLLTTYNKQQNWIIWGNLFIK